MVLIKDMHMPKTCADCQLKDYTYGECKVTYRKIRAWSVNGPTRADWCPLVEVEPYGPEGTLYKEK